MKITANLFVENVEACVRFWVERMGFTATAEVPGERGLVFAIVAKDGAELMYCSFEAAADDPAVAPAAGRGPTFLYVEVESLPEALEAMKGVEIVQPVHDTFYGSREFGVRDPGGHFVTFAQQGAAGK